MSQAVRVALQRLRDTPGFTVVALASLAFGMGLNILIFSLTSPVLFKAMPYPEPDRLLDVSMAPPGRPEARGPLTPPLYALLRDRTSTALEAVGVFDAGRSANLAGDAGGFAERLDGHRITATGLAALGATPLLGRLPDAGEEATDAQATMLLSYPVWQRRFGGRADVVNQTVQVDGKTTLILGVMPEGFGLLDNSSDAWFTFGFASSSPTQETQHSLRAVGRLKPGISIAQAQVAVKVALDEYAQTFPNRDKGWTVELTPWREARFGGLRRPLMMLQLAVGALLFLLSINLAVLLAARTASRERSAAFPPGQSRPRIVLAEGLMLSFGGGLIGAVMTWLGLPAFLALTPRVLPRLDEVAFDASVFAFAAILSFKTGLLIGIVPAWRASRRDRPSESSRSRGQVWRGLLAARLLVALLAVQVALAFVLLAGAGLAIRAFLDLRGRDVGIDPSGLLSVDVHLPREPYVTPNVAQVGIAEIAEYTPAGPALYDRIRGALQTMPGVVQAAGVGTQPFTSAPFVQFWVGEQEHTPDSQVAAQYLAVTENYFSTLGIRIIRGRDFSPADQPDSPWVVLVNEALARQHWPNADPIGQRLSLTFHPNDGEPPRQIVGLVADTLPFRGASEVPPLIFLLHRQQAAQQRASLEGRRTVMSFVMRTARDAPARTTGDPLALGDAVRAFVGKVDLTTPVTSIRTVESYLNAGQVALLQFAATLLGIFALVMLVTSATGIHGLTSYGVTERRTVRTVALRAVLAVVIGVILGLGAWRRLSSVIEPFLTNLRVTPSDPLLLAAVGGVLLATALIAGLVPALRATRGRGKL
jgi:putative ABC transport system permease protein